MAADADPADRELSSPLDPERSTASTDSPVRAASEISEADDEVRRTDEIDPEQTDGRDDHLDEAQDGVRQQSPPKTHLRVAMAIGTSAVIVLTALGGWLGYRMFESHRAIDQRELLLQVGRQGALNLTTIDWEHADSDVQRILDCATGPFYDEFSKRQQPFVDVVKKVQSKTVGTIAAAGVESQSGDEAQILVAVTVNTSNAGAVEEQVPRAWRMRISVAKVGDEAKVSKVEFVG
jgi:Mce-associated membrane protein